jgi:hypothetical protein
MTLQEAIELNRNSFRLKAVTASCRITTAEHEIKYLRKGLFLAFLLSYCSICYLIFKYKIMKEKIHAWVQNFKQ